MMWPFKPRPAIPSYLQVKTHHEFVKLHFTNFSVVVDWNSVGSDLLHGDVGNRSDFVSCTRYKHRSIWDGARDFCLIGDGWEDSEDYCFRPSAVISFSRFHDDVIEPNPAYNTLA